MNASAGIRTSRSRAGEQQLPKARGRAWIHLRVLLPAPPMPSINIRPPLPAEMMSPRLGRRPALCRQQGSARTGWSWQLPEQRLLRIGGSQALARRQTPANQLSAGLPINDKWAAVPTAVINNLPGLQGNGSFQLLLCSCGCTHMPRRDTEPGSADERAGSRAKERAGGQAGRQAAPSGIKTAGAVGVQQHRPKRERAGTTCQENRQGATC